MRNPPSYARVAGMSLSELFHQIRFPDKEHMRILAQIEIELRIGVQRKNSKKCP